MNRLQGKDLINIGIFTAIYFIVIFAAASIGFIPIFIPLISVIVPLVGGIPMMLFFSKIKKFGMLTICGLLLGVIMLLTGMGYWCIPTGLIFGLISDFMMKGCGYKNAKREVLIHGVFSMWVIVLLAAAFVSGLVGGLIGRKLFKKHFERAGIVS